MTAGQEAQAIADARASRDDDTLPIGEEFALSETASVVLSVRLPVAQARALRKIAAERKQSLSALLTDAVAVAIATGGPQLSFGEAVRRVIVTNGASSNGDTIGSLPSTAEHRVLTTGGISDPQSVEPALATA